MSDTNFRNEMTESSKTPQWLDEALLLFFGNESVSDAKITVPSEGFRAKYRTAAASAANIAKLRRERRRIGFVPIPLSEYLEGLIKVAGVPAESVLSRVDLTEIADMTFASARKLARFGQVIEIGLRELLVHVRIGFAEKFDSTPVPLLLAHHRFAGARDQLEQCEAVLALAEVEYDGDLLNELRRTEFEIRAAYKQAEQKP